MNGIPGSLVVRKDEQHMINELWAALGCKHFVTKEFIKVQLLAAQTFDKQQEV